MENVIGVCGCSCSDCRIYGKECMGCYAIEGKACWLNEVGLEVCDFYQCCVTERALEHCGECSLIPCKQFWANKNPEWTEAEHRQIVEDRVILLKALAQTRHEAL